MSAHDGCRNFATILNEKLEFALVWQNEQKCKI